MYERCNAYNIPFKQVGKLVVATETQRPYIEGLHAKSLKLKWPAHSSNKDDHDVVLPTTLLSKAEVREMEPDLSEDIVAALWSPKTGIVDSHAFMESLEKDIMESEGGELVFATEVVRLDPYKGSAAAAEVLDITVKDEGWVVQTTAGGEESVAVLARNVINASGLSSAMVLNNFLPKEQRIPMFYARGSYASYSGPGVKSVKHLLYPCPYTGPDAHAFESLGTHLTLDLHGKIRFGPDIEWIDPPNNELTGTEYDCDFWTKKLVPDESRLPDIHSAVTSYLPGVSQDGLRPDYVGVRPKLIPPGGGFQDFVFRTDYPSTDAARNHRNLMVSLLGIESPGLTSSLAIAEMVVEDVLQRSA
jgi:2-hydroxyglutarate dehydrogenase